MSDGKPLDASKIEVLTAVEAVRRRPHMYVGDITERLLPNLLLREALGFARDRAADGVCQSLQIEIEHDGAAGIVEVGRALPHGVTRFGESELEAFFTRLHAGCGPSSLARQSRGIWSVSLAVLNALSVELSARVYDGEKAHELSFCRGIPNQSLTISKSAHGEGNELRFRLDPMLIPNREFDLAEFTNWSENELTGIVVRVRDARIEQTEVWPSIKR